MGNFLQKWQFFHNKYVLGTSTPNNHTLLQRKHFSHKLTCSIKYNTWLSKHLRFKNIWHHLQPFNLCNEALISLCSGNKLKMSCAYMAISIIINMTYTLLNEIYKMLCLKHLKLCIVLEQSKFQYTYACLWYHTVVMCLLLKYTHLNCNSVSPAPNGRNAVRNWIFWLGGWLHYTFTYFFGIKNPLNNRNGKCSSLSWACPCSHKYIFSLQQNGNCSFLDGRWFKPSEFGDCLKS